MKPDPVGPPRLRRQRNVAWMLCVGFLVAGLGAALPRAVGKHRTMVTAQRELIDLQAQIHFLQIEIIERQQQLVARQRELTELQRN